MIHSRWDVAMSDVVMLTRRQLSRIKPNFPLSHGIPRVDDIRVMSGIIYVIRYGLQWKDAPKAYGPHKTLYNRFVRWSRAGIFNKILHEASRQHGARDCLMIDATHQKAHRTDVKRSPVFRHRKNQQPSKLMKQVLLVLLLALTPVITDCQENPSPEENKVSTQATSTAKADPPQQAREAEPVVISGLGVRVELADHSFEGSSFRVHGIPDDYQVWATITDGNHENYLVFDKEGLHVAEIFVRYEPGKRPQVAPLERYKLHIEKLSEFPIWESQITSGQLPAPGFVTEFTDGRFGYRVTTRGEQRWLLDGWTFKSTEAISCSGPEMCPEYRCICSHSATGRPRIATGDRLACIAGKCVASERCEEFCLSIDFTEHDTR